MNLIELPEGWLKEESNVFFFNEKIAGTEIICDNSIRATYTEFTNDHNDFTVVRRVVLTGLRSGASLQFRILQPVLFPNSRRVSHWAPTSYYKNITLNMDQTHDEQVHPSLYTNGYNLGYKCR